MGVLENYLASSVSPTGLTTFCPSNDDLLAQSCKVLIVAPHNATAVTPPATTLNKVVDIRNIIEAAAYYGTKTVAYRALAKAFCSCPAGSAAVSMLTLPLTAGVAAVYDLTIGGPATATHTKYITLFGKTYTVIIPSGTTVAGIALLVKAALDADLEFPFSVVTTLTGITITASEGGIFGNGMTLSLVDSRGVTVTDTTMSLAVTTAGSGVLDTSSFLSAVGACCWKCVAIVDSSQTTVDTVQAWIKTKGACGPDYCGSMGWFARKESKGVALAFGDGVPSVTSPYNEIIVGLHVNTVIPYPAYDFAVARAVMSCCAACTNPGDPLQNLDSKMLCIPLDKTCTNFYVRDEINSLFKAGWTVIDSIGGYAGLEVERTFHRWSEDGKPTIAYSDPTQIRIADYWFNDRFRPWLVENYGSSILFKDGTTVPLRGVGNNAPDFLKNTKTVTPKLLQGAIVAFMEQDIGIIFDAQNFREKVYAFTDDQLRALCLGDPRVLVVFFDRIAIGRPLRHIFLSFSYTTRTC